MQTKKGLIDRAEECRFHTATIALHGGVADTSTFQRMYSLPIEEPNSNYE